MNHFEPKIVAFLCNWCSYVAAETAGVSRMNQKTNVGVIRVLCSGMVDPSYVLKAFASGADGVLVAGCHPGECYYISGNIKALRRSFLLEKLLNELGVEKDRFRLEWIAASEAPRYAEVVNDLSETIRGLRPFRPVPDEQAPAIAVGAAAAEALALFGMGEVEVEPTVAAVDENLCAGCRTCETLCAYDAVSFNDERKAAAVNEALCQGCGTCGAACPTGAIRVGHYTPDQIFAQIEGILG